MQYLIDGHNLIPKLGMRLDSVDDEIQLIGILQEFCRQGRRRVEVYFDGAPAALAGTRKGGSVTAHFVSIGTTADDAIRKHLKRLGKSARNWTVVTSDRQVQAEARAVYSEIIPSDSFAKLLRQTRGTASKSPNERTLSDNEVEEWLRFFNEGNKK